MPQRKPFIPALRSPLGPGASIVVFALFAGCDGDTTVDTATGPVSGTTAAAPLDNFTNGPTNPGPFIVRLADFGSRLITTDPARDLMAIHGRVDDLTECTDASTRTPIDIQTVNTPSAAQAAAILQTGEDTEVAIYDTIDLDAVFPFDPVVFCAFIASVEPAFEGVVRFRAHINGQGSFNFRWVGTLVDTQDGSSVRYSEIQQGVLRPDGTLVRLVEDIIIR